MLCQAAVGVARTETNRPRKLKRTIKQLHSGLMSLGYELTAALPPLRVPGRRIACGRCKTSGRGTFVPLEFAAKPSSSTGWKTGRSAASDRSRDRLGQTIYDRRHYLAIIQRKPGALRKGAPFTELPNAFKRLQQHLLRKAGGDREMV